jgi:hypothetical protein
MKILKFTAPSWSDADIWFCTEKDWHTCIDIFEDRVDEMEVDQKLKFEVELLEVTDQQWENLKSTFID